MKRIKEMYYKFTDVLNYKNQIKILRKQVEELKKISTEEGMNLNDEIETFQKQVADYKKELYQNLKPIQKLQIARHPERPNFLDYVNHICEDFVELQKSSDGNITMVKAKIVPINEMVSKITANIKKSKLITIYLKAVY